TAQLETEQWQAYVADDFWRYFRLSALGLRAQAGFPFFRAHLNAYWGTQAATAFRHGSHAGDFEQALHPLRRHFRALQAMGRLPGNPDRAAEQTLSWQILFRYGQGETNEPLIRGIAEAT